MGLLSSTKPLWKHLHRHTQRYDLGDFQIQSMWRWVLSITTSRPDAQAWFMHLVYSWSLSLYVYLLNNSKICAILSWQKLPLPHVYSVSWLHQNVTSISGPSKFVHWRCLCLVTHSSDSVPNIKYYMAAMAPPWLLHLNTQQLLYKDNSFGIL